MIDAISQKPLRIDPDEYPYLIVPYSQLDQVKALLEANKVSFDVDEEVLSMDNGPEVAFVNFPRRTDPAMIQRLLDSIP